MLFNSVVNLEGFLPNEADFFSIKTQLDFAIKREKCFI